MERHVIDLAPEDAAFAREQTAAMSHVTLSDFVAALIDLYRAELPQIEALRTAIREGEESGIAEDFDFDTFIARARAQWAIERQAAE